MSYETAPEHYQRKVKIVLHGYLKDLYPEDLELSGYSVAEIINGMCKQTKAFNPLPGQERHCISVVGFTDRDKLYAPIPHDQKELHLVPEMSGGKSGGFFRIIVGVVLIAAAFYLGGAALAGPTLFGSTTIASMLFNFGLSLVLGGLLELISPAPKIDRAGVTGTATDPEASKYLGASQNTVRIGTRIPLLYGEHQAFGHYISFDVDAVDVAL